MRSREVNAENQKNESEQIIDMFGLPKDLFLGLPMLSMAGNRSLCIMNHRGIRQYSSELIVVSAKSFAIQITGKNLYIPKFSGEQVEITGYMEEIVFVP